MLGLLTEAKDLILNDIENATTQYRDPGVWESSSGFIVLEACLWNKGSRDFTSKSPKFNKIVNNSMITKRLTEEYLLGFLYFGNVYCDLRFEIVVLDVGWKGAKCRKSGFNSQP